MRDLRLKCRCGRMMKPVRIRPETAGVYVCGCKAAVQSLDQSEADRCQATWGYSGRICGSDPTIFRPLPLCERHLSELFLQPAAWTSVRVHDALVRLQGESGLALEQELDRREQAREWVEKQQALQREQQVVYYIRRDERIKIGTTTNMRTRMSALLPDEVLATEPGGFDVEKARHVQFQHIRVRGEWFDPADDLMAHIAAVRAKHGEPNMTGYVHMEKS